MKTFKISITLLFLVFAFSGFSKVYETKKSGNWTDTKTWLGGVVPTLYYGSTDTIIIKHNITNSSNHTIYGTFIINSGKNYTAATSTLTMGDFSKLVNSGTITVSTMNSAWNTISFTNNYTITVTNSIEIRRGIYNNYGFINAGTFIKTENNIVFNNMATGTINATNFINDDVLNNYGSIDLSGIFTNGWSRNVTNSGSITVGDSLINNGFMVNSGDIVTTNSFVNNYTSGSLTNSGTVIIGTNFFNNGSLNNSSNISITGSYLNNWSAETDNNGSLNVGNNFQNNGTLINYNSLFVANNMTNNWSSSIDNLGILSVTVDLLNNGTVTNDGSMDVDGFYVGSGSVDGDGDLCNSDGYTDPTSGAKDVTCNICGGEASTLPVELVKFIATHLNDFQINIEWITNSEINNEYFEVLRSFDGINFVSIAKINGAGNSNIISSYSTIDNIDFNGVIYYQLKQVDFDGKSELSDVISISTNQKLDLNIFPNPINNSESFTIITGIEIIHEIRIIDMTGRIVKSINSNISELKIASDDIPKGVYFVQVLSEGNQLMKKIIIQ
jgi:hypothetical protein